MILWTASRQTCRSHVTSLHWRDIPAREFANYTSRSRSRSFRQPCTKHPADDVTLSNSPPTRSPLSSSITQSLFHSRLKTSVRMIPVSGIGRYQRVSVSADTPIILARDTDTSEQQCVWPRGVQRGGGYGYSAGPAGAPRGPFRSIRGIRGLRY